MYKRFAFGCLLCAGLAASTLALPGCTNGPGEVKIDDSVRTQTFGNPDAPGGEKEDLRQVQ